MSLTKQKKPPELPRLAINQQEFAKRMGISIPTARALMNREGFPTIKAGRYRLTPLAALDKWLIEEANGTR